MNMNYAGETIKSRELIGAGEQHSETGLCALW
jgi:hypothetical protein